MKFFILYLLMTLAVVFALPANMEKRGDIKLPKGSCQPSTLTWRLRNLDSNRPQESFQLEVRNTYIGRTSYGTAKVRKTIKSGDNRFSINHDATAGDAVTLTWQGTQYKFNRYSLSRFNAVGSQYRVISREYDYWACLNV